MNIILKTPYENGSYNIIQTWDVDALIPDTHAVWSEDVDTAVYYEYNGFVFLTVEIVDGVDTVTSCTPNVEAWEAWKASLPEPQPEPEPVEDVTWVSMAAAITEGVNDI